MGFRNRTSKEKRERVEHGDPGMTAVHRSSNHADRSNVSKAMLNAVITKILVATAPSF